MKLQFGIGLLLSGFLWLSCSTPKQNNIEVNILHINDVYEIDAVNNGKIGGYARFAYLVDSIKKTNPNVIVVHAGDFLSPSLIGNMRDANGNKIAGKHMIDIMNRVGFDYVTFGNHEFDIKEHQVLERINESTFNWISANVYHQQDSITRKPFHQNGKEIPKNAVLTFVNNADTLKLGLVGVTLPFNRKKFVHYTDFTTSLQQVLDTTKADVSVFLTHLEREQDAAVAQAFPQVPLLMGGHDHYHFIDTFKTNVVAKADANLRTAWLHKLIYSPGSKKVELKSELIPLNESIPQKKSVQFEVDKWVNMAKEKAGKSGFKMDEVVYAGSKVWECRETVIRSEQTNFGSLVANAMMFSTKADIALLNSGSLRYDDKIANRITQGDLMKAMPFGGGVKLAKVKGELLIPVFEAGFNANKGTGGYLQIPNISKKNNEYFFKDEPLDITREYWVVSSSFLASGREANLEFVKDFNWQTEWKSKQEYHNDIRQIVIQYLQSNKFD